MLQFKLEVRQARSRRCSSPQPIAPVRGSRHRTREHGLLFEGLSEAVKVACRSRAAEVDGEVRRERLIAYPLDGRLLASPLRVVLPLRLWRGNVDSSHNIRVSDDDLLERVDVRRRCIRLQHDSPWDRGSDGLALHGALVELNATP